MSSTIDHVGIYAPKDQFESIIDWYKKALAPLNYKEIMRFPGAVGLGSEHPDFWISETDEQCRGVHYAFVAPDHATVDAFHQAALEAGGKCNGAPGIRSEYHPKYYGAFVLDPLGNNVEVISFRNPGIACKASSSRHSAPFLHFATAPDHAGYPTSLPGLTTMVSGRSEAIAVVTAVFLGLALIMGSVRCFVRFRLTHAAGCDDYMMVAAMFFNIGFGTCTIVGATFGMGKKLVYFEDRPQDFRKAMLVGDMNLQSKLSADRPQCFWLGQLFYVVTSVIVRLSIAVTLLRLTVDILHRSILYAATVLSVVAGTIFFFFSIFQCTPVDYYWNQMTEEGYCMDMDSRLGIVYMYSAAAAVCDFTIGLLPVFMIGRLKMDRHTKMAVIGILSIGCVASTAVIVRMPFLQLSKSPEFLCFNMVEYRDWDGDHSGEFNDRATLSAGYRILTFRLVARVLDQLNEQIRIIQWSSVYHLQPRLDDILNDVAPFPYTLGAFIAFLSEHQCLETVEFLLETERYRRIYHWLEHKSQTRDDSIRKSHLSGLWNRLINQYIRPHSKREINIPSNIRQELMQHFHNQEDDPPPPELLDRAVTNVKELLRGSILIPFLRRSSATARVQPLSMPCLNDCLPGSETSAPCIADDIRVNRCPREDYPWVREDSSRRYGFYGEGTSSSSDDEGEYVVVQLCLLHRNDRMYKTLLSRGVVGRVARVRGRFQTGLPRAVGKPAAGERGSKRGW
ncbi:hypothetical protein CNMCM5793_004912 [Aspergillus hiratsukae]|uniref:VOC domain-containing protein n=1 Tax=Aspergillus hiratsukae TaxID=1194566 RepID=A0A8H6P199_9EURO|nr:hypothetical protein CNMCM5793_004912 [Aspergillus hiratsukae]